MKVSPFDPADHLDTPERVEAFLEAARIDGDPAVLVAAHAAVVRAFEARSKGSIKGLICDPV